MRERRPGGQSTGDVDGGAAVGLAPGKRTLVDALAIDAPDPARAPELKPAPPQEIPKSPTEMTGIGATIALDRFATAAKSAQKNWGSLTPEQRAAQLGNAANAELDIAGVKQVDPQLENLGARLGEFHFKTWILGLGRPAFSAATVTDAQAAEIAATVYHEARHAEQWYRMARMLIAKKMTPEEITDRSKIPLEVTQHAKQNLFTSMTKKEADEASTWFDSVYGAHAADRAEILTREPVLRKAYDDAVAENKRIGADPVASQADKTAAAQRLQQATATYRTEILDKYHALPEEADSEAVEGQLKATYRKKK
jgi:hypothetical protein